MGLRFAVLTAVARDDLADGGAARVRARRSRPFAGARRTYAVEVLIPDCKGDPDALATIFAAAPDVLNHNIETVPACSEPCGPSASTPAASPCSPAPRRQGTRRSRASSSGSARPRTRSIGALADLRAVGVEIVTLGQYLRPTDRHLPVARWWTPEEFDALKDGGRGDGHHPRRGVAADAVELPRRRSGQRVVARSPCFAADARSPRNRCGVLHERMTRARARMGEQGVDVLLLSVGPDLPYLTGYEAMPLERLTMLVLPARRRRVAGRAPARGAPGRGASRSVHPRAVGGDRRSGRAGGRARRRGADRRDRRPHVGPLRARAASANAADDVPEGERRHRSAPRREGRRRDRRAADGAARPPTASRRSCRPATSRSSAAPRPRSRRTSPAGSSPRATTT